MGLCLDWHCAFAQYLIAVKLYTPRAISLYNYVEFHVFEITYLELLVLRGAYAFPAPEAVFDIVVVCVCVCRSQRHPPLCSGCQKY